MRRIVFKMVLALLSFAVGVFIFLIGKVGNEQPKPFWWYALVTLFFVAPLVWLLIPDAKPKG
jgi:hypothetical protein